MKEFVLGMRSHCPSSFAAALATLGVAILLSCRAEEEGGPPPLESLEDALDVQEDARVFQCECYAPFQQSTVDDCLANPRTTIDETERACIAEVFDGDPESLDILLCESEVLRGLLACERDAGCPEAVDCGDGQMIPENWMCDEINDCANGFDEGDVCFTEVCDDGERLLPHWVCDEFPDCLDGSDEVGCPPTFTCDDGQQVPGSWVCDEKVDCPDGSDEDQSCPETCERRWIIQLTTCGRLDDTIGLRIGNCLEFTCIDGLVLMATQVCDGVLDCAEGEDELDCEST